MRRRKSPRVVWLPQTNANTVGNAFGNLTSSYQEFALDLAGDPGDFVTGEIPLVADGVQDPLAAVETSLADIYDSGYRLRRIVGKVFCTMVQEQGGAGPKAVLVTAGIIVRRIDPTNSLSLVQQAPNSAELMSPSEIRNTSDPWVWRRTWQLNNRQGAGASIFADDGPTNNYGVQAGSALDGPHVDQKTARIIGPEERLFLSASMTALASGQDAQSTSSVFFLTDLRVLGSLRQTSGNRRNASR